MMVNKTQPVSQKKDLLEMNYEAYLSSEDINSFLQSKEQELIGFYYEWEGENVVHIHSHPLIHAFGKSGKCLFTKSNVSQNSFDGEVRFVVSLENLNHETRLYTKQNGDIVQITPKFIPQKEDLYSRSKGLLEIGVLSKKHVAIVGLGSFGSQIAIELSKAGVGEFSLFDFDRVELHNLARHTCTLKDLGRLKTDAIEEAILGKNPYAAVHKYAMNITKESQAFGEIVASIDLLICATDNNDSRFVISTMLHKHQKVGIFGRAITRAAGGDVFRYRPGGPCYACLIGSQIINAHDEEISSEEAGRRSGAIPAYASADDVNAMVQVGLSVDIEPICNMMLKLALVELSRGEASGISSLEDDLKYDAYIWANRRDNNFAHWHPFFQSGKNQTILKWYGINVPKDDCCPICSETPILDTDFGEEKINISDFEGIKVNLDDE